MGISLYRKEKTIHFGVILFVLLLTVWPVQAQNARVRKQQNKLQSIRKQIHQYRQKLAASKKKEATTLEKLARIEREIDLTRALLQKLSIEQALLKQKILDQNKSLLRLTSQYAILKKEYSRRVVHYYKEGPLLDWGILLSVHSVNQALVWLKYRKLILDADKRRLRTLQIQKERISQQTDQLRKTLQKQKALIAEKMREKRNLAIQKSKRQRLLRKIRNNKRIYAQKIREYKEAEAAIKRLIRSKEVARTSSLSRRTEVSHFATLRGKLPWPTNGRILHHYGKIRNKKLHTVQENIGVDIKAPFGTPVRSAADGVVTAITWQRGRGNILIIDHYGGYYTVYAHLSEILVVPGQKVRQGEEIGKVGNSGSLSGSMLHFEIWKKTKIMNPEHWLRKKRG